jgi:iron complex outermembrane receptor protein
MRKYGYNAFLDYKINDKTTLALRGGGQNSEVQNLFASEYLTTAKASTYYADFKAEAYGASLQVSYLTGTQSPNTGVLQWKWNLNTTDIVLDYNFTKIKNLSIRPGITYRRAAYDDSPYVREEIKEGFWNGKQEVTTIAGFLRLDYRLLNEKLRLIAAGRLDKFNAPDDLYFSWQLAATYKLNENNLLRIVHGRANRSPLIVDTYLSTDLTTQGFSVQLLGNENLELLTSDMLEVGYRGKLKNNLELDIALFGIKTKNYSNIVVEYYYPDTASGLIRARAVFQNLTVWVQQIGGTISFNYVLDRFQFMPYITIQQTTLYDYSPYSTSPDAPPSPFYEDPDSFNTRSGIGTETHHVGTPTVYGGAFINCELGSNFNLNINPYFFSGHTQLTSSNLTYEDGERGVQHVRAKLILNITLSYTVAKKLTFFANFRNCFNDKAREFYKSDTPDFKVLGGASFEF